MEPSRVLPRNQYKKTMEETYYLYNISVKNFCV